MESHTWMSKTFESGVEGLQPVVLKVRETVNFRRGSREDRRINLDDLCILVPEVSRSTIYGILTEKLQYHKVCARWLPRMLTEDHKRQRVDSSREFFRRYADEKGIFLASIVTSTKPGRSILHLRPNNNHASGGIPLRPSR